MAGSPNSENAVTAIKSILGSDLAAKLDALDTAYGDDIVLEDPVDYWEQTLPQYDAFPCVVVVCRNTAWIPEQGPYDVHHHQIEIDVVTTDRYAGTESLKPQEELTRRLNRTAEAIVNTLFASAASKKLTVSGTAHADRLYYVSTDRIQLRGFDDPDLQIMGFVTVNVEVRISC